MMNAGTDYGVRVIVAYEQRRVGDTLYPPGTLRQRLVRCGLVVPNDPPVSAVEPDLLSDAPSGGQRSHRKSR